MRKYLALVLALTLTLTLFLPALGAAEGLEEITILYPGEETDEMANFINGPFAEKMKTELNLKVNMRYLSWADYWDQKKLMLAAAEYKYENRRHPEQEKNTVGEIQSGSTI